jgi:hypothetical protein
LTEQVFREQINDMKDSDTVIGQYNLIDIHRIFHPTTAEYKLLRKKINLYGCKEK